MDAYTTALTMLSRRELSSRQLRDRLARRRFPADDIEEAVRQLTADRQLDDHRVAVSAARSDATIRRRGRRRALQHLQQLGISSEIARTAVDEVFGELDESALLDEAIARRLKRASVASLDAKALGRLVRGLIGQGFDSSDVYARLRKKGAATDE